MSGPHASGNAHGPTWIPILTAVLALLATVTGLVGGLRDTQSDRSKSDAIIAVNRAGQAYNEGLHLVARGDAKGESTQLAKAHDLEEDADRFTEVSEHYLVQHEIFAVSTTFFEIAIVLVSIRALIESRVLTGTAGAIAAAGLAAGILALVR